jgi:Tol biopolymer transport system component
MPFARNIRSLAVTGLALIALAAAPREVVAGDPNLRYRTISTEHFRIHFHQGIEEFAHELAGVAEEVHAELSVLFGWEVDGPTEIVISDSQDDANGSAMSSPRPIIWLYTSPPTADSSLANHDDWIRTLFTHEYTHVIHLQMHGGFSRVVDAIFGDVYLPNQMQPTWFIEGMAVLEETYRTTAGRIRSSQFRASIRVNALEGKLLTLGEVSNDTRQYPRGNTAYIYGAMFLDYVRARFGEEKLYEICREYGSNALPYGLNRTFKRVLGVELVTLYDEWRAAVRAEAQATKAALEAKGLTRAVQLTDDGEGKGQPLFSRDGRSLLLSVANGEARSSILAVPLDGSGRPEALVLSGGSAHLSSSRRGDLFYTRSAPYENVYRFSDVFALGAGEKEARRVTHGARAREAAVSPSGLALAMVIVRDGRTRLVLADERGVPVRDLLVPAPGDQVYHPAWSPDGRRIAVVVRRSGAPRIEIVDAATGAAAVVYEGAGLESDPVFDPSGRYLVFSSDRTGIADIYALDLEGGSLRQLTNVLGGASAPAVSWDGKRLAYLSFSTKGLDLQLMGFDPEGAPLAEALPARKPAARREPAAPKLSIGPYNPLPSLLPRMWLLGARFSSSETVLQATTSMNDAVGNHAVAATLSYGLDARTMSVGAGYAYYGMVPSLHLGVSHATVPREDGYLVGGIARGWDQVVTSGSVALAVSVPGVDRNNSLSVSYQVTHAAPRQDVEIEVDPNGPLPKIPLQYFRAGVDFGWSYADERGSPFGISTEDGRAVWASVGVDHPAFGSSLKMVSFRYGWEEFVEAPWLDHHVLALRLSGVVFVSDPPEQAAAYVGGYTEQNLVDALWNNVPMGLPSLRGYPLNAFAGDQAHVAHLEYRFPIWWFEAAYKTAPLYLRELHAAVFTDNALITFDALDRDDWRASVGAELVWAFRFGYFMPITIRLGYARGLMAGGGNEVIAVFGNSF